MTDRPPSRAELRRVAIAMLARMESWELSEPAVVLLYDPEVQRYSAVGPFPTPMAAAVHAQVLLAALNDPKNNDGPKITASVIPFDPVEEDS